MAVGILGDRASGKTTFLILLYAAAQIYNTLKEDRFRFTARDPRSYNWLTGVYAYLESKGHFPDANLKGEWTEIKLRFGFRRGSKDVLPRWITDRMVKNPFNTFDAAVYDISGEDVREFVETGMAGNEVLENLFASNVAIFLIDCSRFSLDPTKLQLREKAVRYDGKVGSVIKTFEAYKVQVRDETGRAKSKLYPIFIFSKWDMIGQDVLAHLQLRPHPPPPDKEKERDRYFGEILRSFMTQTFSVKQGARLSYVNLDNAAFFPSWVDLEKEEGMPRIEDGGFVVKRERTPGQRHSVNLRFSATEYIALIDHLGWIAARAPDDIKGRDDLEKFRG